MTRSVLTFVLARRQAAIPARALLPFVALACAHARPTLEVLDVLEVLGPMPQNPAIFKEAGIETAVRG